MSKNHLIIRPFSDENEVDGIEVDDVMDEVVDRQGGSTYYMVEDNKYIPSKVCANSLPAGFYYPEHDEYNGTLFVAKKNVLEREIYDLPNPIHQKLLDDIRHFWESEKLYKGFGNIYKRNILLYSIPGNGKTSLINLVARELIEKYNGIIICIDTLRNLGDYVNVVTKIREIEPKRKIVTVIEDFDKFFEMKEYQKKLLQILDGSDEFDNIVTIATTNYPESIGTQFTKRPSRFNLVIEYPKPNREVRKCYILKKLENVSVTENTSDFNEMVERYVEETEGMTFDYLKEFMQGIYVDELTEEEILGRIRHSIEKDGKYQITEDTPAKIGFLSGQTASNEAKPKRNVGFGA